MDKKVITYRISLPLLFIILTARQTIPAIQANPTWDTITRIAGVLFCALALGTALSKWSEKNGN